MEIVPGGAARANYYDRNPAVFNYAAEVAAGAATSADTQRFVHTVTAGKKAYVEVALAQARNKSTTALNNDARAYFRYQPNGGTTRDLYQAKLHSGMGAVVESFANGDAMLLSTGDAIEGRTVSDNNAAGSNVELLLTMKVTEFDA